MKGQSRNSAHRSLRIVWVGVGTVLGLGACLAVAAAVKRGQIGASMSPAGPSFEAPPALALPASASVSAGPGPAGSAKNGAAPTTQERVVALQNELLERTARLDAQIRDAGLDGDEINARYNRVSEDEFYTSLPEPIRAGFRELHERVAVLQDLTLAMDGKTRADLAPASQAAPDWVVQRAVALEKIELPAAVAAFVDAKSRASSIENADLRRLASLCGSAWPCIEKGAYELLKANHQFTDEQFQLLSEYQ